MINSLNRHTKSPILCDKTEDGAFMFLMKCCRQIKVCIIKRPSDREINRLKAKPAERANGIYRPFRSNRYDAR